ncbi:acyltransferase family protein [Aeromicrobium terrae]|uniref:acyltransferase family protein n=1 Tax=Aeromicrobium terrae TaxID=2498846 RepID=UPI0016501124|nr:acyltransferase family protein [Aeromicrobium terrae]
MTVTAPSRRTPEPARAPSSTAIRGDVQGLRALAVSLVLLFHLWPNRLSGGYIGVDVFFVISGYLITSHLLGRPPRDLRGLGTFWSRRIRRLLPASFLVLAVTLLASRLIAPETQWANTARDVRGATLYILNWRLAGNSVDYLAAENAPSPVQHFWSLSVEEQFYLGWPVLMLVLGFLAVRRGRDALTTILGGLAVVVAASFTYSVWMGQHSPAPGYFVTPTRIWELGIGALLAGYLLRRERSGQGYLAPAGPARAVATVLGLAAVVWAAFDFSGATRFPGWHAAIPVLGCALLIGIGPADRGGALDRVLDNPAARWLGDISYSVYLWHWPMIVLLPSVSGGELGRLDKAAIIVTALVLSALTKTFVEDRYRRVRTTGRSRPRLTSVFVTAATGMVLLVGLTVAQTHEVAQRQEDARASLQRALSGDQKCFGANAMTPGSGCGITRSGDVVPAPAQAVDDHSTAYDHDCRAVEPFKSTPTCTYGDPDGDVKVAITGNSHAVHFLPALDRIGKQSGWKITTYLASACRPTEARDVWDSKESQTGCYEWGQRVLEQIRKGGFDLVVMSNSTTGEAEGASDHSESLRIWQRGYEKYLGELTRAGGPSIVAIRDVPTPARTLRTAVPDCVAEHRDDLTRCSGPRKAWLVEDPLIDAAKAMRDRKVRVTDLTDRFCDARTCFGVIGGVIVYFDHQHISATYSISLARYLAEPLSEALGAATG